MIHPFRLIPATREDESFLFELYASVRQEEVSAWGWGHEEAQRFLKLQCTMQQLSYGQQFPSATCFIVKKDAERVGRCFLLRASDHLRLIDISLLSSSRGQGLGTAILRELQKEAQSGRIPIRLSVSVTNPVRRLYERLGFRVSGTSEIYLSMEWTPENYHS